MTCYDKMPIGATLGLLARNKLFQCDFAVSTAIQANRSGKTLAKEYSPLSKKFLYDVLRATTSFYALSRRFCGYYVSITFRRCN